MSHKSVPVSTSSLEHAATAAPSGTLADRSSGSDPQPRLLADTTSPDGVRLGSYLLEHELGAGGMGEVFAARHLETDERVALKTLSRASATLLYRFKREFRALADVTHPNLVRLFELGQSGEGRSFFTMELLDGRPFVDWVRAGIARGDLPDLARLDAAFRQLVAGIRRLHADDCVHRDLKPSNVLVTASGRVVILDFGLVSELGEPDRGITRDGQALGTPAYMAPEQALGRRAGMPADWYAAGVMLYQCLTGVLPYQGTALQMLVDKQHTIDLETPLRHVPARLREICVDLLDRNPDRRLGGAALVARLDADASVSGQRPGDVFVGRREPLAALHDAFGRVCRDNAPVVVQVRGRSGEGKTTLLRRFRDQLRHEICQVFHGRCRERETVPYKGIDAIVDALSAELRRFPRAELDELQPRFASALVRVFPVLDELWTDAQAHVLSPRELRGVSWGALREIIDGLARDQPLVLCIDDFQWADSDSVQILHALLRPPHPPSVLLVLGVRNDLGESELLRELGETPLLGERDATLIELEPLSPSEARELALALRSGDAGSSGVWAETIAVRSGGNPLFITQMVGGGEALEGEADLDGLIARRIAALSAKARAVLDLVAVFGGPLAIDLALALAPGVEGAEVDGLREAGLLVVSGGRIETAYDRIREVVRAGLEPEARASLHTALGRELLRRCGGAPDGELLFRIVDQLDAGIVDPDALEQVTRLELARLNSSAGQAAFTSGSHGLAFDYFERARRFVDPWLAEARRGDAQQELCFAIEFGRARTITDPAPRDVLYNELLEWSLGPDEYGRVVIEWMMALYNGNRTSDAIALGLRAFARLGVSLPRRPSLIWALLEFERGHRALRRLGAEGLIRLPQASDPTQRAVMSVMGVVGSLAIINDSPLLGLGLISRHARLITQHGFHDQQVIEILHLIPGILVTMGRMRAAAELGPALRACAEQREQHAASSIGLRIYALFGDARVRRIPDLIATLREDHRSCCELGLYRQADACVGLGPSLCCEADIPIPDVIALIDELLGRSDHVGDVEFRRVAVAARQMFRVLIEGTEQVSPPGPEQLEALVSKYSFVTRGIWIDVMLGDYADAWPATQSIANDFERVLLGVWLTPVYACVSSIVMAERWPLADRRERRRLRRTIKRRRKLVQRWTDTCPENYATMLALIDAELAVIAGHVDEAMLAYEHARKLAEINRMRWAAGVASHRLAIQAHRRGHSLVANAALEAAIECYRAWGATAVVTRLERGLEPGPLALD